MNSPERQLAIGVILQAVNDLNLNVKHPQSPKRSSLERWAHIWRAEALQFLTSVDGDWARSREVWCAAAGLDHLAVAERIRRKLLDK